MKQEFIDAIEAKDIITVRLIISNELLLNPKGDTYRKMKEYAEANVLDLYETHDGGTLDIDEENLSVNVLVQIKNDLDSNFSRERIAVYERVAGIVLSEKKEEAAPQERPMHKEQGRRNGENGLLGLSLCVGLGAMTYGMFKGNLLTSLVGAVAASVSGAKLYSNKKNGK